MTPNLTLVLVHGLCLPFDSGDLSNPGLTLFSDDPIYTFPAATTGLPAPTDR